MTREQRCCQSGEGDEGQRRGQVHELGEGADQGRRARLRQAGVTSVPILTQAASMIASYLAIERDLGRIAADADVETLAPTLIGAVHLLFADREGTPPTADAVSKVVTTVIAGAVPRA